MADRNADNDNDAPAEDDSERDDWVLPFPPNGAPRYALIPWPLFERLRARQETLPQDAATAPNAEAQPIRSIDAAPLRVGFEDGLSFPSDAPGDLWPKSPGAMGSYDDESAAGAIPLALLDRLLDGEHPLKVFRRHRGLTQKELALRTGLNATYLSQIETRKRGGSTRVYRLLAAALNVEIGDLIE